GTNSGTVLEGSRMLYALSLDRRMGPVSYVHPRFRTPIVAILIHVTVAAAAAVAGSFAQLALLSTVARLATYLAGCASLPFLGGRTAKTITLAILGCAVSMTFVLTLHKLNAMAAAIALLVGAVVWVVSVRR
ncbi:MAG TPA: amino acid transporter, partial [Thermoanaerobaculia bacterium]